RKKWKEASHRGHREKTGGAAASLVGERGSIRTVAQQRLREAFGSRLKRREQKSKPFQEEKRQKPKPSSGDCVNRLAQVPFFESNHRAPIRWQHRLKRERPMCTERINRSSRVRMEAWRQWLLGGGKNLVQRKTKRIYLTPTGLLMEGDYTH